MIFGLFLHYFTKLPAMNDLVSFGEYLLSDYRRFVFSQHPVFGSNDLDERLQMVYDCDLVNWNYLQTLEDD